MGLEKDLDKGLPVAVGIFFVAVSALLAQVLALRNWLDLENFCSDSSWRCMGGGHNLKL